MRDNNPWFFNRFDYADAQVFRQSALRILYRSDDKSASEQSRPEDTAALHSVLDSHEHTDTPLHAPIWMHRYNADPEDAPAQWWWLS